MIQTVRLHKRYSGLGHYYCLDNGRPLFCTRAEVITLSLGELPETLYLTFRSDPPEQPAVRLEFSCLYYTDLHVYTANGSAGIYPLNQLFPPFRELLMGFIPPASLYEDVGMTIYVTQEKGTEC